MKGKNKVCRKVSKTFSGDSRQLHRLLPIKFLTLLNFSSETQKGHDFWSCSAKPRASSTQTKLQASQTKQFIITIVTLTPRLHLFVCTKHQRKVRVHKHLIATKASFEKTIHENQGNPSFHIHKKTTAFQGKTAFSQESRLHISVRSAWPQQPCREGLGDAGGVEQTWVCGWCFRGWSESFGWMLFNTQPDFICCV